ncbi:MAG: alpha-L-fucosidase [Pontiella sp.]
MKKITLGIILTLASMGGEAIHAQDVANSEAESSYILNTESPENLHARLKWWKEARFGMFVHWGLYSSAEGGWDGKTYPGGAEWIQKKAEVPADIYEKTMLPKFKPAPDFATQWARLAKQAGAGYVVFTSKHHEGFSMNDSAQTDFDAKAVTGRDLHKEIVEAIRRENLGVGVYHSLWDWHHPDAPAGEGATNIEGLTMEGRELPRYVDYLHAQVNEVTDGRYGAVDILWLDYSKHQFQGEAWRAKELVALVRNNQPSILINNRLWNNVVKSGEEYEKYWLGDFSTPEQHIPATGIEGIDWETCDTLNGTWGWSKHATGFKSSTELVHRLVDAVSKGGNYLLNIGPLPDGTVDPVTVQRLSDLGRWMQINGEAIYSTKAGPFTRLPWGRVTSKTMGDGSHRLYLHVFDWPEDGRLYVPGLESLPTRSFLVGGKVNQEIHTRNEKGKMVVTGLPENPVHVAATVIALDFYSKPKVGPYRVHASTDGSFTLEPADAVVEEKVAFKDHGLGSRSRLEGWEKNGRASYRLQVEEAGTYSVEIAIAVDGFGDADSFSLSAGDEKIKIPLEKTGGKKKWKTVQCGSIRLPAGEVVLDLQCAERGKGNSISLSTILLKP